MFTYLDYFLELRLSTVQLERLQIAAVSAVACERNTRVPAELTVAQWVLESGWGQHQPCNNCFGIKSYPGCYGTQLLQTTEVCDGVVHQLPQEFATFPSLAACFEKHALLISLAPSYAIAWRQYLEAQNLDELIRSIAPTYSTNPDYAQILLELLAMTEVQSAISAARNTPHPSIFTTVSA